MYQSLYQKLLNKEEKLLYFIHLTQTEVEFLRNSLKETIYRKLRENRFSFVPVYKQ